MAIKKDFRLKIETSMNLYYLVRRDKHIGLVSGSETPNALSNVFHDKATLARFAAEDALNGDCAARDLRKLLLSQNYATITVLA